MSFNSSNINWNIKSWKIDIVFHFMKHSSRPPAKHGPENAIENEFIIYIWSNNGRDCLWPSTDPTQLMKVILLFIFEVMLGGTVCDPSIDYTEWIEWAVLQQFQQWNLRELSMIFWWILWAVLQQFQQWNQHELCVIFWRIHCAVLQQHQRNNLSNSGYITRRMHRPN